VGAQSGQERLDVGEVEGLRESSLLADQPATPAGPAGAEMAEHPAHGQPQSLATPDHFGDMYGLSQICGGASSRTTPPPTGCDRDRLLLIAEQGARPVERAGALRAAGGARRHPGRGWVERRQVDIRDLIGLSSGRSS
jgi:hypothetical protein